MNSRSPGRGPRIFVAAATVICLAVTAAAALALFALVSTSSPSTLRSKIEIDPYRKYSQIPTNSGNELDPRIPQKHNRGWSHKNVLGCFGIMFQSNIPVLEINQNVSQPGHLPGRLGHILCILVSPNVPQTFWVRARHFLYIWWTRTFVILKHLANMSSDVFKKSASGDLVPANFFLQKTVILLYKSLLYMTLLSYR